MKKIYYVGATYNNMRIDRWIRNNIDQIPQSLIEKNLRNGKIKLNKKKIKSSQKVKTNDQVEVFDLRFDKYKLKQKYKFQPSSNIIKANEKLIIDNNDDFVVINKKAGISVQGGTKSKKNLTDIFSRSKIFQHSKPFTVHRLDKDTSGVFMIAKHRESAQLLTSLFRLRKIHKTYIAICHGEIQKNSGEWNNKLIRYENNKAIYETAKTFYRVLDKNSMCSLLELKPITGRKHQLRKQLYSIGNPIYGDQKYKLNNKKFFSEHLMLHSFKIKFMINDKKYTYRALLPDYFKILLKKKKLNLPSFL